MITYKITTKIGQKLTAYKHLALSKTKKQIEGVPRFCKNWGLRGC